MTLRDSSRFNSIFLPTGEWIPSIEDGRPMTLGSGRDYRDRPTVLSTDCDRERETLYHWNNAAKEMVIHLFCNRPDKSEIELEIKRMKQKHEVKRVTVFVSPEVFQNDLVLVEIMKFERDIRRERQGIPYLAVTKSV
jgi:hypothetical protein